MLYLTCTIISSVDLAQYRVFRAKDLVSVNCGTRESISLSESFLKLLSESVLKLLPLHVFISKLCGALKSRA